MSPNKMKIKINPFLALYTKACDIVSVNRQRHQCLNPRPRRFQATPPAPPTGTLSVDGCQY